MRVAAQLPDIEVFTVPKVLLMFVPSVVTIAIQATRISASITAYSTAVGPSSLTRNREIDGRMRAIVFHLQEKSGEKAEITTLHLRLLPEPNMGEEPPAVEKTNDAFKNHDESNYNHIAGTIKNSGKVSPFRLVVCPTAFRGLFHRVRATVNPMSILASRLF